MQNVIKLEALLKRDRLVVMSGLAGVTVLAWTYMFYLVRDMQHMAMEVAMPRMQVWSALGLILMFFMWAVMMVAMMLPSAAPMILLFTTINRKRQEQQKPFVPTAVFLLGYLFVWTGFSIFATLAQWGLHAAALLSPMMLDTSPVIGGILFLVAGIFQWTPLKHACLTRCRSPLSFLMTEWREGTRGALMGNYCVVCCWAIMSLMFVVGVMNLLWMGIIAAFVLVEKVAPRGRWVSWVSGFLLMVWGTWMMAGALG
jgi:predicted metal-binding membrane protein